jgi:hypothetical protein
MNTNQIYLKIQIFLQRRRQNEKCGRNTSYPFPSYPSEKGTATAATITATMALMAVEPAAGTAAFGLGDAAAGDPEGAEMVLSSGAAAAGDFFSGAEAGAAGVVAATFAGAGVSMVGVATSGQSGGICTGDGAIVGALQLGACAVAAAARTAKMMAAMTEREADISVLRCAALLCDERR